MMLIMEREATREADHHGTDEELMLSNNIKPQANQIKNKIKLRKQNKMLPPRLILLIFIIAAAQILSNNHHNNKAEATHQPTSAIKFEPDSNAYSGLTFTFDPRLDKRVDGLHFEHWHSTMQQSSALLYEALNGRAHLAEVRVLIPYKWRHYNWPILHKPGALMNRRLRYSDSDVIVGFDDPIYKETPFAVQHDECARPGLNIKMPISFLESSSPSTISSKLKARQFVREFASHRYGIFKESGFRYDPMYPPFSSLAGLPTSSAFNQTRRAAARAYMDFQSPANPNASIPDDSSSSGLNIRGFDENWNECSFETNPATGLPVPQSMGCMPYLSKDSSARASAQNLPSSLNIMSSDPFSYSTLSQDAATNSRQNFRLSFSTAQGSSQPLEWRDVAESASWHFCGDNFPLPIGSANSPLLQQPNGLNRNSSPSQTINGNQDSKLLQHQNQRQPTSFQHNQLTTNKQNIMCQERSAMEVIKSSEDFNRRNSFSPSTVFNILPATNFKFLQEMPPRIILCVEYAAHLYQSRRLDHGILDSAITKFLAYDLIADTELALVLFGQQSSNRNNFRKLDQSVNSRLTLYSPPIDPFDEAAKLFSEQELIQMDIQAAHSQSAKIIKGTCSFSKMMLEAMALLSQTKNLYDDIGADIIIVSSGLFIEDELKIEEIIKQASGAQRMENLNFNIIIYPSTMLFDTKSRDGYVVLDAIESETIIRARLSKLHLIQRLTNAKIHLIKEHLDSNGDVKMSTLTQFHQIFEHISKGHSWDQTSSMVTLAQQPVEARPTSGRSTGAELTVAATSNKLQFQFQVDSSLQNSELIVGFIDPKHRGQQQQRTGKRFAIKNLELRSPNNQIVLTDAHPFPTLMGVANRNQAFPLTASANSDMVTHDLIESALNSSDDINNLAANSATIADSALFAYRSQLNLAGFHLKPSHLAQLVSSSDSSFSSNHSIQTGSSQLKLAGLWTLTATSDEPIQTSAIAMAQTDPSGETLTANCWIQTYYDYSNNQNALDQSGSNSVNSENKQLKQVKVFMELKGSGAQSQELQGRLEIQDELGNIVQNNLMLDDGLGTPDMTRGDSIHSQYVQRAHRPGYYKASIELAGSHFDSSRNQRNPSLNQATGSGSSGQDNACCGSQMGGWPPTANRLDGRHVSRQLYCGTFFMEPNNRLGQQRPPMVNNLTVANVDQDNRRVTLRWFEPQLDISSFSGPMFSGRLTEMEDAGENISSQRTLVKRSAPAQKPRHFNLEGQPAEFDVTSEQHDQRSMMSPLTSRYEIKLFTDRDAIKRAFDSKHVEVGFRFHDTNVEGLFPNGTVYGGMKELTLRVPHKQEGIYYVAMKVYNNLGVASQMSNIIQFYLKNNLSAEDLEAIYGQATTVDAEGNVYDKNGDLIQRAGGFALGSGGASGGQQILNNSLFRLTDGLSVLIFIGVVAFVVSVMCISLTACIAGSARKTLAKMKSRQKEQMEERKAVTKGIAGSGSSMASSGSSELTSSGSSSGSTSDSQNGGSQGGHDVEINKLSIINDDELVQGNPMANFNHLQRTHLSQQQQAQIINKQLLANYEQQQQQQQQTTYQSPAQYQHQLGVPADQSMVYQYQQQQQPDKQWVPQHTMVNGYAYATVMQQQQQQHINDLNQSSLKPLGLTSPIESWPADILLSHYDKVKQARERNEAPPVMRLEALDKQNQLNEGVHEDASGQAIQAGGDQSYLVRQKRNQMPSYFNQQLQQQLSSVLRTKRTVTTTTTTADPNNLDTSTPALEGLTDSQYGLESQQQHGYSQDHHQIAPPYMYAVEQMIPNVEPTIYSQLTNLQQVNPNQVMEQQGGFYANQDWQQQQKQVLAAQNQEDIYSTSAGYHHHQQQQLQDTQSNSAISEV